MATYEEIYGKRVKEFDSDPTLDSSYEGQVWYNTGDGVLKSVVSFSAFISGGWNDPCLLLAETWTGALRMTQRQSRAQFSMWAVMASPLIISANIRNMSRENIETYTNTEVIAGSSLVKH